MIGLEGTQLENDMYKVVVTPQFNYPFTLYVRPYWYQTEARRMVQGWVVSAKPQGDSYYSRHRSMSTAVRAANYRGRRYLRAYSRPRGLTHYLPANRPQPLPSSPLTGASV